MPKITINEKDYIPSSVANIFANIVLVPGNADKFFSESATYALEDECIYGGVLYKCTTAVETAGAWNSENWTAVLDDKGVVIEFPRLFETVEDFENIVGKHNTTGFTEDTGYKMAHSLLEENIPVLYDALENALSTLRSQVVNYWDKFTDKYKYNIKFLTTGGMMVMPDANTVSSDAAMSRESHIKMIAAAASRGDCIALVDFDKALDTSEKISASIAKVKGTTFKTKSALRYGAAFAPWIKLVKGTYKESDLPASFAYIRAFALSTKTNPEYLAVAGSERGLCPETVMRPLIQFGAADVKLLQEEDRASEKICVNPICDIYPYGQMIWGNRTLSLTNMLCDFDNEVLVDNDDLVASNFLNIRQLITQIKKQMYAASIKYRFEQNSDILWINFKAMITPLLDKMLSGNGINGYKFIRVATDKKAKLAAKLTIIPVEAVEDFELTLELADTLEIEE